MTTIRDRTVFFDVEAFRHVSGRALWCVGARWIDDGDGKTYETVIDSESPDSVDRLRKFVNWIVRRERLMVGFNVRHYDLPFIAGLVNGHDDAKRLSDELIRGPVRPDEVTDDQFRKWQRDQQRQRVNEWSKIIPERLVLDVASRYRESENEALRKGLKPVAALLGFRDIRELPYPPDMSLTDDQWSEVMEYNRHDLRTTGFVFRHHEGTFEALALLSESCGVNLVGLSDSDAAETYFLETFRQRTGTRAGFAENMPESVRLRIPDTLPNLRTPEAASWKRHVTETEFPFDVELKSLDTRSEVYRNASRKFVVGDLELSVGFGGIHSVHANDVSEFYRSDDTFDVINCDVRSYYPNLILNHSIPIGTTGSVGADIYREALEKRLELKRRSKDKSVPESERRQAKTADTAFKIVVNSLYGKLGYRWSRLNTPGSLQSVTMTGQLGLIDLIESLQSAGCRVVQANTDGVVFIARKDDQRWRDACSAWESRSNLVLEFDTFAALALHDSNNWLALRSDGSMYGKGSLRVESGGHHQHHFPSIVNRAVMRALADRVPPDVTVRECDDVRDFLFIEPNRREKFHITDGTTRHSLGKVIRGFAGYPSKSWQLVSSGTAPDTIPDSVLLALEVPERVPAELNREWYVGRARKTLESFPLNFDPAELTGDARRLFKEHGLVPQPAFAKSSGSGTNKSHAISCVDWSVYPTLKAFTGHRPGGVEGVPGIVAFDIDDPEKWQAAFGLDIAGIIESDPLTVHKTDTPEPVRNGTARGKLLFRLDNANHRFADKVLSRTRAKWLSDYGFEIRYGQDTVAVFGDAGSGQRYRLSGTLGVLPKWFEAKILSLIGKGARKGNQRNRHISGLFDQFRETTGTDTEPEWSSILETLANDFDERFRDVGRIVTKRGLSLPNGKRDERHYATFKCPGGRDSHESGNSKFGDGRLFLDSMTGRPIYQCLHTSCKFAVDFDQWSRMRAVIPAPTVVVSPTLPNLPDVVPTPISDIITSTRGMSLIEAATGSGKTHGAAVAAGIAARAGRHVFFVTTSTNLVRQFRDVFLKLNPDLADRFAIKRDELNAKFDSETEDVATIDEEFANESQSTDDPEDKVLVRAICHESLGRRDFSRFARHMWKVIRDRPDSLVILDEFDAFVSPGLELRFPFAVRTIPNGSDKHQSWKLTVLNDCPASVAEASRPFSSCEHCHHHETTGRFQHSKFGTPTLERPAFAWRKSLDEPVSILSGHEVRLELSDFDRKEPQLVHDVAHVEPVIAYKGQRIDRDNRRRMARNAYAGEFNESTTETPDTIPLVLEHVIGHMLFPAVKTHFPVDASTGEMMTRDDVLSIDKPLRSELVNYPIRACHVPYLVGVDGLPLELLREFVESGGDVVMMTATVSELTESVSSEVFRNDVQRHKIESPNQRIKSLAVVTVMNDVSPSRLNEIKPESLKRFGANDWHDDLGNWLILSPSIRSANLVSSAIDHSDLNFAVAKGSGQSFGEERHTTGHMPVAGTIGSVRQPVGRGYDGVEISAVIMDVNSTRLAVDMMVRHAHEGENVEEIYDQFTNEELMTTIAQSCGRGLRGDDLKRFFVVLINCPPVLAQHVVQRFGMDQRANRIEYVHYPCVSDAIFRDGERWLAKIDDQWTETMTIDEKAATKHERRILERAVMKLNSTESKRSKLLDDARDAMNDGMSFRDFVKKHNVDRKTKKAIPGVLEQVREVFASRERGKEHVTTRRQHETIR